MNIALTGATTDLGKSILTHLSRTHTIGMLTQPGFTYDAAILGRFFKDKDALVHCAAELDLTPKKLEEYVAINALLTGLLASLSARAPRPPKFIYMSSAMVYQLPDDDAITRLARQFAVFCQEAAARDGQCDLLRLARRFIAQNNWFPFARYNGYTLTKYLGEAAALALPGAAVLRVSNAYGPGYDDPRLIPRLIMGRLTGRGASYIKERRDFVYCEDINRLVGAVLKRDIAGVIDCCSNELTSVKQVRDTIVRLTPTAYGKLVGNQTAPKVSHGTLAAPADANLPDIIGSPQPFGEGLAATLLYHKAQCY
ncbi:MAG TPA: NAD-dependent epimerase/dehydratase family protein, partial [Candidatus Saccharimonadales bacterium]